MTCQPRTRRQTLEHYAAEAALAHGEVDVLDCVYHPDRPATGRSLTYPPNGTTRWVGTCDACADEIGPPWRPMDGGL